MLFTASAKFHSSLWIKLVDKYMSGGYIQQLDIDMMTMTKISLN